MKYLLVLLAAVALGRPAAAEKAPHLVLADLEGEQFSLEKALEEGIVVLDFWATWCKPCIRALPGVQEIAREYAERGVQVYTINVDGPRNQPKLRPFLRRYGIELPVLLDATNEAMKLFQLVGPPATVIATREGGIVYKHQGYRAGDERRLREKLDALLDQIEKDG